MKKTRYLAFVLIVIVVILCTGCGSAETPAPTEAVAPEEAVEVVHEGKGLVASKCITCHTLGVVENKRYDRDGWQSIIEQMILTGAQLDEAQKELVIDYLAINFPKE